MSFDRSNYVAPEKQAAVFPDPAADTTASGADRTTPGKTWAPEPLTERCYVCGSAVLDRSFRRVSGYRIHADGPCAIAIAGIPGLRPFFEAELPEQEVRMWLGLCHRGRARDIRGGTAGLTGAARDEWLDGFYRDHGHSLTAEEIAAWIERELTRTDHRGWYLDLWHRRGRFARTGTPDGPAACQRAAELQPAGEAPAAQEMPVWRGPTGPAWERAKLEPNWLVAVLRPKGSTGRFDKVPTDQHGNPISLHSAGLTFDQAHSQVELANRDREPRTAGYRLVGYVPRSHSALALVDLDGGWYRDRPTPGAQAILDAGETYAEISPSGNGLRLLIERTADTPALSTEGGGHGLFAAPVKFGTISLDGIPSRDPTIRPAPGIERAVLDGIERYRNACRSSREDAASKHSDSTTNGSPVFWFDRLSPGDQLAEVERMLSHLTAAHFGDRDPSAPEGWFRVSAATFEATGGSNEGQDVWDRWCRTHANYDAAGNDEFWSLGLRRTIGPLCRAGTLIALARKYGYQPPAGAVEQGVGLEVTAYSLHRAISAYQRAGWRGGRR